MNLVHDVPELVGVGLSGLPGKHLALDLVVPHVRVGEGDGAPPAVSGVVEDDPAGALPVNEGP